MDSERENTEQDGYGFDIAKTLEEQGIETMHVIAQPPAGFESSAENLDIWREACTLALALNSTLETQAEDLTEIKIAASAEEVAAHHQDFLQNLFRALQLGRKGNQNIHTVYPLYGSVGLYARMAAYAEHFPDDIIFHAERLPTTNGTTEERKISQESAAEFLASNKIESSDMVVIADDIVDKRSVVITLASAKLEENLDLNISGDELAQKCCEAQIIVAPLYSKNEEFFSALDSLARQMLKDPKKSNWAQMQLQMLGNVRSFEPTAWLLGGMDQSLAQQCPESPPGLLDGKVKVKSLLTKLPKLVNESFLDLDEQQQIIDQINHLSEYDLRLGATCRELYAFVGGDFDAYVLFMARMLVESIRPNLRPKEA